MFEIICSDGSRFEYRGRFDVLKTMSSGQMFRWIDAGNGIEVHSLDKSLVLNQRVDGLIYLSCDVREFHSYWENYFDLKTDYRALIPFVDRDPFLKKCWEYGQGLRLLNQDLWETIVCFILSQRSSIPKTTKSVELLCEHYGNGNIPAPETLMNLDANELANIIRCGYRARYLVEAGSYYISNGKAFERLDKRPTAVQETLLLGMRGVGQKVADCIILFGLHNRKSFPVDIWIERILDTIYDGTLAAYKYGDLAGVIQQYMYYYAINHRKEFDA